MPPPRRSAPLGSGPDADDPAFDDGDGPEEDGFEDDEDEGGPLQGEMLVAMPGMGDPRFSHTVIYVCSHGSGGAMGLIVNKPAKELKFGALLKQVGIVASPVEDLAVRFGGPVEVGRGFVLHTDDWEAPGATKPLDDGLALTATVDILREIARGKGPRQAALALGYAGWAPGQLEGELARNGWLTCPSDRDLIFGGDDDGKWDRAMRKIGVDPALLSARGGQA